MKYEIIIVGSGGQGIQLLGEILAEAAAKEGKEASLTVSYGAAVRGGESKVGILISDKKNDYTEPIEPNLAVVFSKKALDNIDGKSLKEGATVLYDDDISLQDVVLKIPSRLNLVYVAFPATKTAVELGNAMVANMVILGYLVKITKIIKPETALSLIGEKVKEKFRELNKKAFNEGFEK